ncbi:putative MFS family arabinose efflux permease [Bogoriella caseilytica]|uniref:Putative MFS family arabinose efflux permease n=1 Tax=Bogoriella caseilytica TaxID=56055 RepID=A0A3N2BCN0_9MICO|nr:putative MFS family arabinose efflux permease [Bogoriella caseilytica]
MVKRSLQAPEVEVPAAAQGLGTALAGMLLIATTYGMARFGVGLFGPAFEAERPELAGVLGWAAAAQFTSFSVAALLAARLVGPRPRWGVALAGATAAGGSLVVAFAGHPALFIAAVFLGGMGAGFASPALVRIVDAAVPASSASTAQGVVNSGTAVGVVGAGMVAFTSPGLAAAWVLMAALCVGSAAMVWLRGSRADALEASAALAGRIVAGPRRALAVPAVAAAVAGAASALVWTFGPLMVTSAGALPPEHAGWLWVALGLGGLLGVLTGALVHQLGIRLGWLSCAAALALAIGGVGLSTHGQLPALAYGGMALFGAAYMSLSGVLILWAREAWPGHGGEGTSLLFIALATGQAVGSATFGLTDLSRPGLISLAAVVICVTGGLLGLVRWR